MRRKYRPKTSGLVGSFGAIRTFLPSIRPPTVLFSSPLEWQARCSSPGRGGQKRMFHHSGAFSPTPAEASGQHAIAGLPESDAGLYLDDLPVGNAVNVETGHHTYHVENRGDGKALIQGHPKYCPEPVEVELLGSTRGGAMLKMGFIGIGLR